MAALAFGALNVSYGDDTNGVAVLIRDVKKLNRVVSMIANRLGTQNQRLP